MARTSASSHQTGSNNALVEKGVQQRTVPTLEEAPCEMSVPLLSESAHLLTILRQACRTVPASYPTLHGGLPPLPGSRHSSTPDLVGDDDDEEGEQKNGATTVNSKKTKKSLLPSKPSPNIRLNSSFLIKPRVISAVSGKGIFKNAYIGGGNTKSMSMRNNEPNIKIGNPLALPPRLPSVRAGQVVLTKNNKSKEEATVVS